MNRYIYFAVFISGMTSLAVELAASRLIGVAFGTSNLVWASIIGLILIYLTAGYFLGGRWADKYPSPKAMYTLMAWAAFTTGLTPFLARPVLTFAASAFDELQVGVLFGSFSAVLILFAVPVTLMGTASPFAIRLAVQDAQQAGEISGRIYAISTLGSFIGTFLPVLLLIPLIGTTLTFIFFSLLLLITALGGLALAEGWRAALKWIWMALILILLALTWTNQPLKRTEGQIFEAESAYNYIQVLERSGYRLLRLNEGQGVHSFWHPTEIDFNGTWEQFLAAPFFNLPEYKLEYVKSIAIVGLAAGTTARQATAVFGPLRIDGFEIDPAIIAVGREYFDMNLPNLNAIPQDGRVGLARSRERYNIIGVDAYRPPYIPFHLTTREFFQLVYDRLSLDGAMVINVGRSPDDRSLVDDLAATIQTVFPSVYVMDVPDSFNSIIYATAQPTRIEYFYQNLLALYTQPDVHPMLLRAMETAVMYQRPLASCAAQAECKPRVYTDDRAPIEWVTNNMVLNYVLGGEQEELP